MRGVFSPWRTGAGTVIAIGLLAYTPAAAQSVPPAADPPSIVVDTRAASETAPRPLFAEVFSRVAKDPTTYVVPVVVYTAHRLDWDSSQKLFAYGYLEANPKFTVSGRVADTPIGYAAGKRKILKYSLSTIGNSLINNTACALVERRMIDRNPEHRKLIRTLGWLERGMFAAYWSNVFARNQANQWRDNERVLADLHFRGVPLPTGAQ